MSKTGFSTLNRWLGRKSKEKPLANGKLSKSSNNLSISTNTINDVSHTEYNRITPLPVATNNAPFEQTFRITVLLPKDQLYVTRLGAQTRLHKLLELVCENKSLDIEKYEFRNPADSSQIYDCELTIGAVGLSEIRLCHKSESYDTFNDNEIIRLHRTSIIRDSLSSSSDFSSRISKQTITTKTTSPYSSTNSLNSMDSSGLNYIRTPIIPLQVAAITLRKNSEASLTIMRTTKPITMGKVMAPPPRKKRTAPKPPSTITSQNVVHEKALNENDIHESKKSETSDINGNNCNGNHETAYIIKKEQEEMEKDVEDEKIYESIDTNSNGYTDNTVLYAQVQKKNADNRIQMGNAHDESTQENLNSNTNDSVDTINENYKKLPEPSPRKRIIQNKKKSAPAPPLRNSCATYGYHNTNSINSNDSNLNEDTISLASTHAITPLTPISESNRNLENMLESSQSNVHIIPEYLLEREIKKSQTSLNTLISDNSFKATTHTKETENDVNVDEISKPKPIPRMTTTTLLNATDVENDLKDFNVESKSHSNMKTGINISKVILNRIPTPEPCSLISEPTEENSAYERNAQQQNEDQRQQHVEEAEEMEENEEQDDNISKQADSGIGEPTPSPIPDSLPNSEISTTECKSNFESSSDDDDMIKVYNFKLGKTLVKPLIETIVSSELVHSTTVTPETDVENAIQIEKIKSYEDTKFQTQSNDNPKQKIESDVNAWTFSIPISPPPTFADGKFSHNNHEVETFKTDTPITPKINERPILDFENFDKEEHAAIYNNEVTHKTKPDMESLNKRSVNLNKNSKTNKEFTLNLTEPQNNVNIKLLSKQRRENQYNQEQSIRYMQKVENTEVLNSPTAPLNGLLEELSSIIQGKGIDSLVRSRNLDNGVIESAKPNTLDNFSITNIKGQNMPKWKESQEDSTTKTTAITTKLEANIKSNIPPVIPCTTSKTIEEEKLYRKRNNANNLKQRRSISRADSFHATVSTLIAENFNLQSRSASQLALNKLDNGQNNHIARRSSSDLSIGESPCLQSLEVIKTILRTHKNKSSSNSNNSSSSINNDSKSNEIAQDEIIVVKQRRPSQELKFASLELKPMTTTKTKCNVQKYNFQDKEEEKEHGQQEERKTTKELPKTYRYSGPPSVNVGTWNERPKVQVAIKNEGDYIFGGKKNSSITFSSMGNCRNTMAPFTLQDSAVGKYQKGIAIKAELDPRCLKSKPVISNHRMSMPNSEFSNNSNNNTNITVKPYVRNAVCENNHAELINGMLTEKQKRPTIETVLRPQTQIILNTPVTTSTITPKQQKRFSTYLNIANCNNNNYNNNNNSNNNNNNNNNNSNSNIINNSNSNNNNNSYNNILRSTSIKRNSQICDADKGKSIAAPFGQNTLRRTGLKEKFLAKEIEQQQQQEHTTEATITNPQLSSILLNGNGPENNGIEMSSTANTTITMNLKKTLRDVTITNHNNNYNNTIKNNSYCNNSNKSPIESKRNPPSNLAFKRIQLKTVKADKITTLSNEPEEARDQLLAAIRNFNKTQLKKT